MEIVAGPTVAGPTVAGPTVASPTVPIFNELQQGEVGRAEELFPEPMSQSIDSAVPINI